MGRSVSGLQEHLDAGEEVVVMWHDAASYSPRGRLSNRRQHFAQRLALRRAEKARAA